MKTSKAKLLLSITLSVVMVATLAACGKKEPEQKPEPEVEVEQPEVEEEKIVSPFSFTEETKKFKEETNDEAIGWVKVPNTDIDDVVVQAKDNKKYLRLDSHTQQYSFPGCYYADYENSFGTRDQLSKNTIIYGHNIDFTNDPDGVKFGQLFRYEDPEFAKENPYIYFSTGEEDMVWEVFANFHTNTDFYYIQVNDIGTQQEISDQQLMAIADEAKALSVNNYNVDVKEGDKILTLSTCSYIKGKARSDVRYVVMARLVPADEGLKEEGTAVKNPTPKEFK